MDIEKKYRWALTGLIVMILLNAATLITIWVNQPDNDRRSHRGSGHDRDSIQEYMKEKIGLTDEQAEAITEMRRGHYREIRTFRDSLEQNRRVYFEFIMSEEADNEQKRDSLRNLLTEQYENIEGLLYNHMTEVKELLNEEQQDKFEELMLNMYFKDRNEDRQENNKGQN
ncbi:MAG: periplasmic heavy metal sensor [Gracilimonas sp.]